MAYRGITAVASNSGMSRLKEGFTLIELVAGLVILGVLGMFLTNMLGSVFLRPDIYAETRKEMSIDADLGHVLERLRREMRELEVANCAEYQIKIGNNHYEIDRDGSAQWRVVLNESPLTGWVEGEFGGYFCTKTNNINIYEVYLGGDAYRDYRVVVYSRS